MAAGGKSAPVATPGSPRRLLRAGLVSLLVVPALAVVALWQVAASPRALDWALRQAVGAADAAGVRLEAEEVSGSLLGAVSVGRLGVSKEGLEVEARGVEVDLDLLRLALQALRGQGIAFERLSIARLRVSVAASDEPPTLPRSLALPVAVSLASVEIARLEWVGTGASPIVFTELRAGYAGDGERHRLEAIALRWHPSGEAEAGAGGTPVRGDRGSSTRDAAPPLALAGEGAVGATAPFPIAVTLRAGWGVAVPVARGDGLLPRPGGREGTGAGRRGRTADAAMPAEGRALVGAARIAIEGSLAEPRVRALAEAARGAARARIELAAGVMPFAEGGLRLGPSRLSVDELDPSAWWPGAPSARLTLHVEGAPGTLDRPSGRLRVVNAKVAAADAGGLPVASIEGPWQWDRAASRLRLDGLRVRLAGAGTLAARLVLDAPPATPPRVAGEIDAREVDLRALGGGLPTTRLSGRLALAADAAVQRAEVALAQPGLRFEARIEHGASTLRVPAFRLQAVGRGGPGEAQGRFELGLDAARAFAGELALRAFDPSALHALMPQGAGGAAPTPQGSGRASAAAAAAAGAARDGKPGPDARPGTGRAGEPPAALRAGLRVPGDGRPGSAPAAEVPPARGTPSASPWPAAVLNGRATVRGRLQPAWQAEVDLALAASEVMFERPLPLRGALRARIGAQRMDGLDLRLESGRNRLRATGAFGQPGDGVDLSMELADPGQLLARASGRLTLNARLDGTPERPALDFRVNGETLAARGISIGALQGSGTVAASVPGAASALPGVLGRLGAVRLEAQARRLALPGQPPFDLVARLAGDPSRHQLEVEGRAPEAEARATLVGGIEAGPRWRGELRQLDGRSRIPVRLLAPVAITAAAGDFRLGPARLTVSGGRVAIDALEWREGRLATRGSLAALPLGPIHDVLTGRAPGREGPRPIVSTLEIGGEWALATTPEMTGTVTLRRERGDLALTGARPFPLGLTRTDVDLRLDQGRLRGRARLEGAAVGEATATVGLEPSPRLDADAALALRVDANVRSLRPFARLLPAVAEIDGAFVLRLEGTGTLRQPVLSGALTGQRLRVDAPQVGVALRDGRVEAALAAGVLTVSALEARGGDGRFTASGAIPLRPGGSASSLRWQADRLALLSRPDRRVVLDGQGAVGFERGQYRLSGQLRAREGYIELGRGNRTSLGDDVVIRGRGAQEAPAPTPAAGERALALQLEFDFGDSFRLIGSGLDTLVRGRVALAAADGGPLSTRGTVSTERGTFTAFGQRLEIERGAIVFNGPVDNPGLDIVALRRLPSVQAGVELSGTARAPRVRITSNPPLPQGEQLSWLVLGRALDSASQADAAMLAGAAAAMFGGDGGVPVNRRIADAFGLDDVGVRSSGVLAGQVVTVGKRVSDRVYFAYEQAVSTASNLLRIDFELHRFVSLRAEAGSVSGFGVVFTRNLR
jgi:translocation and assembly module TamB